jgi:hypothetical protein
MAKMCPLDGCKAKPGLCIHEKMMLGASVMMVLAFGLDLSGIFT